MYDAPDTPDVREIANGMVIDFRNAERNSYMTFEVTYIESISWGLLATVTVRTNIENSSRLPDNLLLTDRLNLQRNRELRELASRLNLLAPPEDSGGAQDWQRHLEHVASIVYAEQVKPVPVIDLMDRPLAARQRFLIDGLLAKGKANILYGPGGTGKSVLAVRMAGSVVTGQDLFGFDTLIPGSVLYLDWEDDPDTMVERIESVRKGMGLTTRFPLAYKCLRGRGPYERHHADISNFVKDQGIDLVIFDSTGMAMHGSSSGEGADAAIKFFSLINQLTTTCLLIDHVASDDLKSGTNRAAKPYGSVFKVNSARNVWQAAPWNPDHMTGITLLHNKTNVGPKMGNADVQIEWAHDEVTFTRIWGPALP